MEKKHIVTEKRHWERIRCYYYLKLYDKLSHKDLGSIIDISNKGMKVICESPFVAEARYEFTIKLPKGYIHGNSFDINAECRWCQRNDGENYFEAGFRFANNDSPGVMYMHTLINDFKSNDLL